MTRKMANADFRKEQTERRYDPHVERINRYVDELRESGRGWVPYVAPIHGGTKARVLLIGRDPGRATQSGVGSGMLCLENNDPSAALTCELMDSSGLTHADITPWNAYPWYIDRCPTGPELQAGLSTIVHVVECMADLRVAILQGGDAKKSWNMLKSQHPNVAARCVPVETYHPSPNALQTPDKRERHRRMARRFEAFKEAAQELAK